MIIIMIIMIEVMKVDQSLLVVGRTDNILTIMIIIMIIMIEMMEVIQESRCQDPSKSSHGLGN